MILAKDIVNIIEEFAPPQLAESYDNTGFLIGKLETSVNKLMLCVDVTPTVVEEAKEAGANMIISHHPLIFGGIKSINGKNSIERCIIELIKNDICLYCCHTSVDATIGGISYYMGNKLSLTQIQTLSPINENGDGFGIIGNLSKEMDIIEFLELVKDTFNVKCLRYTEPHISRINKVAMCGGSGASLLEKAKLMKADIFVSADFKYHNFFEAENQIIIADIGHFESEKVAIDIFSDIISKKYPNFAVCKSKKELNPVLYL